MGPLEYQVAQQPRLYPGKQRFLNTEGKKGKSGGGRSKVEDANAQEIRVPATFQWPSKTPGDEVKLKDKGLI